MSALPSLLKSPTIWLVQPVKLANCAHWVVVNFEPLERLTHYLPVPGLN
jgi:hypothetical protein